MWKLCRLLIYNDTFSIHCSVTCLISVTHFFIQRIPIMTEYVWSLSFINYACLHEYLTDGCRLWGDTNWMHFKFFICLQRYFMFSWATWSSPQKHFNLGIFFEHLDLEVCWSITCFFFFLNVFYFLPLDSYALNFWIKHTSNCRDILCKNSSDSGSSAPHQVAVLCLCHHHVLCLFMDVHFSLIIMNIMDF